MLSALTRTAIGLLDVLKEPHDLNMYLIEAASLVPNPGTPQAAREHAYLDAAMSICHGRNGEWTDSFDPELTLEKVAAQWANAHPRLSLLAGYYHTVMRLARVYKDAHHGLFIVNARVLEALHQQFTRLATSALALENNELSSVCLSLAAECLWRAGGSIVEVISLAGQSNMVYLGLHCDATPRARTLTRQQANIGMLACSGVLPPPAPNFLEVLYEPGELLRA